MMQRAELPLTSLKVFGQLQPKRGRVLLVLAAAFV